MRSMYCLLSLRTTIAVIGGMFLFLSSPLDGHQKKVGAQNIAPLPFDANAFTETISHNLTGEGEKWSTDDRQSEFLIDTNIVYTTPPYWQSLSSMAFDGTNYMIVWSDERRHVGYGNDSFDIFAARVSPEGIVLDSSGIIVFAGPNDQVTPSIAFDGTNYFVVWLDKRNGDYDIYGARVSQSGVVLDTSGFKISTADTTQSGPGGPSVAFDGTNYLVVWVDTRNGPFTNNDIYGSRINQSGVVLDTSGFKISIADDHQNEPTVAFDGTNYLVAWADKRNGDYDIYGARVTPSGSLIDSTGILISTAVNSQWHPSISFGDMYYLVVWEDWRNLEQFHLDIYGARITTSGEILDTTGIAIGVSAEAYGKWNPSVAFDGTNYLAVWEDNREVWDYHYIYGARVNSSGAVLDSSFRVSPSTFNHYRPSIAFGNMNYLVAWQYGNDVFGTRLTQSGTIIDTNKIAITLGCNMQTSPAAAFDGVNYLMVWGDWRGQYDHGTDIDVYGIRLNQSGMPLDTIPFVVSTGPDCNQINPSIVFTGTNYFAVWNDYRYGFGAVYGARINQSGVVLDSGGIKIAWGSQIAYPPDVAFDGTNCLVVWHEYKSGAVRVYGSRIDQAGSILDTIEITGPYCGSPIVAFDAINYLVVYRSSGLSGKRITPTGVVIDGFSISAMGGYHPSIAFGDMYYLVMWVYEDDIWAARVTPSGVVLDTAGIPISVSENNADFPAVAFDGTDYVVTWQDDRNGNWDIYGAKISSEGMIIDSFLVVNQSGNEITPALAHGSGAEVLITYSGWTDSINTHPAHTMRIWGKFHPFIGIEEHAGFRIRDTGLSLRVYPNPFNKMTSIKLQIPNTKSQTSLRIYDAAGRLVKDFTQLLDYRLTSSQTTWQGDDDVGRAVPPGVYFVRLESGDYKKTEKVILLK
ncbi:MAG: T9SS type A sorting domain-containing protein [bacterium]